MRSATKHPTGWTTKTVFMVEVYRSSTDPLAANRRRISGAFLVGTIDIPADELTLYLVRARNAEAAARLVRDLGASVIRVTAVMFAAGI